MNRYGLALTLGLLTTGCRVETPSWQLPQGYSDTYRKALLAPPTDPASLEFDAWAAAGPVLPPTFDPAMLPGEVDLQTPPATSMMESSAESVPQTVSEPPAASQPFIPAPHLNLPTPARIDGADLPPSP